MAEPESTVINTHVKQVKGYSLQNTHPVFLKQVLQCHCRRGYTTTWSCVGPNCLCLVFSRSGESQGCWAPGPNEVHVISTSEEAAGLNLQLHRQDGCICLHLHFGAAREKAAASVHI